jgi:hypothetical protein
MNKPKPTSEPRPVITWTIHFFGSKLVWLGHVNAVDEEATVAAAAVVFKKPASKLQATRV